MNAEPKRKYLSEFAVNLFSGRWLMLHSSQVNSGGTMDAESAEVSANCHIYAICQRPAFSFDPNSFKFEDGEISGNLIYRIKGNSVAVSFKRPFPLYDGAVTVECSAYPHRELLTKDRNGTEVRHLPAYALAIMLGLHQNVSELRNLEVLYIGQAFANGKRNAHDRLKSHSTLQRILAEAQYNAPDNDIWVLTFEYAPYRIISQFDGRAKEAIDGEEDRARFVSILENPLSQHQQICLIEAALIRYFKPKYNEIYKESFPSANQKILAACFELDFSALAVEINTEELSFSMYSEVAPPNEHHITQFDLVDRNERLGFFSIIDRNGKSHTPDEIISMTV